MGLHLNGCTFKPHYGIELYTNLPSKYVLIIIKRSFAMFRVKNVEVRQSVIEYNEIAKDCENCEKSSAISTTSRTHLYIVV